MSQRSTCYYFYYWDYQFMFFLSQGQLCSFILCTGRGKKKFKKINRLYDASFDCLKPKVFTPTLNNYKVGSLKCCTLSETLPSKAFVVLHVVAHTLNCVKNKYTELGGEIQTQSSFTLWHTWPVAV